VKYESVGVGGGMARRGQGTRVDRGVKYERGTQVDFDPRCQSSHFEAHSVKKSMHYLVPLIVPEACTPSWGNAVCSLLYLQFTIPQPCLSRIFATLLTHEHGSLKESNVTHLFISNIIIIKLQQVTHNFSFYE
jgi:hypothetical protein